MQIYFLTIMAPITDLWSKLGNKVYLIMDPLLQSKYIAYSNVWKRSSKISIMKNNYSKVGNIKGLKGKQF